MKLLFLHVTVTTALVFSTVLLSKQQPATARPVSITPTQAQELSRDLIPSQSQEFFRRGQTQLEQEIQSLYQPRIRKEPVLKTNVNLQRELNRLPQLSGNFWPPT